MKRDFVQGLTFWLNGWRYLFQHRNLLRLALWPLLIVMVVTLAALGLVFSHLGSWSQMLLSLTPFAATKWMQFLYYPLVISAALVVLGLTWYIAFLVQHLLAVVFHSLLAERVLVQLGKKGNDARVWNEWAKHTAQMVLTTLAKTAILLLVGLILFVFSFLPGLNLFTLWAALALVAFDCMDYSFEALGLSLRQRFHYMFRELAQWTGMTMALGLTLLIPGLTLLVVPGAVVGAALIIKAERV